LFNDFGLPGTNPPLLFGDKPVGGIALGDIEAWREARREIGRSPVTINHDLKLLRKMFNGPGAEADRRRRTSPARGDHRDARDGVQARRDPLAARRRRPGLPVATLAECV
jgi:hypothetical protein